MKLILRISIIVALFSSLSAKDALEIKSMKELKEIMGQQKPLVMMFYAPWCSASKEMLPAFNRAAILLESQATIVKIDVEKESLGEVIDLFSIDAVPTIVIRHTGRVATEDLVSSIQTLVKKPAVTVKKNEPSKETPKRETTPQKAPQKRPAQQPQRKQSVKPLPVPSKK